MTTFEQAVKDLCKECYQSPFPHQIVIDFMQERVEDILSDRELHTGEEIGALAYEAGLMLEVYNPAFEQAYDYLKRLTEAIRAWNKDVENTNRLLNLPLRN